MEGFGFDLEFIDVHSLNIHNKKELNRLFNSIEDLCYVYETKENELSQETKERIEAYIIYISQWTNLNKNGFGDYSHKYLDLFKSIQTDLNNINDIVAQLITPIHSQTMYNWLGYFKSSDAFYMVKGNHKLQAASMKQMDMVLSSAMMNAKKSIKTEKMAGYHLYIISGQASLDYKKEGDGLYYKKMAEKAIHKKDLDLIAPARVYDGVTENKGEKIILFATTNERTEKQDVFKVLKKEKDAKIVFVFAPTFNQSYSYIDTTYNGRKATQHGTAFLKHFNSDFDYNELADFNMLPFMALINNVEIPEDTELKITDFLQINPFAYGTDTYYMYRTLRDLNEYYEPEKTEKLHEFFVDYIHKITNKLATIESNYKLDEDTETILINTQRVILGILNNFNKSNLPNELPDSKMMDKILQSIHNYNNVVAKMDLENSKVSTNIKSMDLKKILDQEDLIYCLKQRNKTINFSYQLPVIEKKKELTEKIAKDYFDFFHHTLKISKIKSNHIVEIIKMRQLHPKQKAFIENPLSHNAYMFIQQYKEKNPYKDLLRFIENNFDYNNPIVRDEMCHLMTELSFDKKSKSKSINVTRNLNF